MSNAVPLGDHPKRMQAKVISLVNQLGYGKRSIRTSYDLARSINVNQRAIGYIAREARLQGYLVGSVHGEGYYLIETKEELDETFEHLVVRIQGIRKTLEALIASWKAQSE